MTRLIAIALAASAFSPALGTTGSPSAAAEAVPTPASTTSSPTDATEQLPPDADANDLATTDGSTAGAESPDDERALEAAPNPTIPGMNRESREPASAPPNTRPGAVRKPARNGLPASASRPQGSIARTQPNSSTQSMRPVTAKGVTAKPVKAPAFKRQSFTTRGVRAQPVSARGVTVKGVTARGIKASTVRAQGVKARPVTARGVTTQPVRARPVTVSR